MRVNIVGQGGYSSSGLTIDGATLTGPLTLSGDPVSPLEAATKGYVDLAGNSLDASKITTGTLAVGRMPAFTGDLTSATGNNVLTLGTTGVVAGTYTKVTVDVKGRVAGAGNITVTDVPNLDWNKITSGKPTTLSGYGITNGVSINGDSVTGYVTAHADPTSGLQLATKQYVDSKTGSGGAILAGTTIRRTSTTTPVGYLRCNGALASKTTYPALYAIFGDNAVSTSNVIPGAGKPWCQQYEFNTTQSSDITGWSGGTSLPGALSLSQAIVTRNRVYLLGGLYDSAVATVYTAPINSDGTLGTWSTGPSLPVAVFSAQVVITKNRVYLLGGINASYADISTVYTAPINSDGTLGGWSTGPSLPGILSQSQAIVTKNRVYLLGGAIGFSSVANVYTAPINSDGTLGGWSTGTSLPAALSKSQAIVTQNRVYLLGGTNGGSPLSTVYTAPINGDGTLGAWSTGTSLPAALAESQAIVTQNRVYLLGGTDRLSNFSTVYTAPFSGGLNDYSTFYTTGYTATDPDNFRLPDTTTTDTGGLYTYIKT